MAAATGGMLTNGHRSAVRSRNVALFSIFGVISGGWLLFRSQAPKRNELVSDEERETFQGSDVNQTTAGHKAARAPERGLRSP